MGNDGASGDDATVMVEAAPWLDTEAQYKQQLLERREEIFPAIESMTLELEAIENRLFAIDPSALGEGDGGRERRPYRRTATVRVQRGQHNEQFLAIVNKHPDGITVAEIAREAYGDPSQGQTTYLYKVGARLEEEGAVVKRDTRYYPAEQAGAEDHAGQSQTGQADSERSEPANA